MPTAGEKFGMGTDAAYGPAFSFEIATGFVSVKRGTAGGWAETFGAAGTTGMRGIRGVVTSGEDA